MGTSNLKEKVEKATVGPLGSNRAEMDPTGSGRVGHDSGRNH